MKPLKILLADDHCIMRMGLATLIGSDPEMTVVGEAGNGEEAVRLVTETAPDVIIMDLMMPRVDGAEATRLICETIPETKVLILTSYATSADIVRAIDAGASGAIVKDADNADIINAITEVASGGTAFSGEISRAIETEPMTREFTQKQLDVLHSITRGLSNPDIAKQLGISLNAVKQHIRAVFTKLGASNRTEAVAIALRKHLLKI